MTCRLPDALLLYGITPHLPLKELLERTEQALAGGITILQYRDKLSPPEEQRKKARILLQLCHSYGCPLIVNDSADLALEIGADGLHIGLHDESPQRARLAMKNRLLGISAHNCSEALQALHMGADYLGCGAVFPSATKSDARPLAFEELKRICHSVPVPVVAIGGIGTHNIRQLSGTGIAGAALSKDLFNVGNVKKQTEFLLTQAKQLQEVHP